MMKLRHSPEYYRSSFFKWRQRLGFGISDYACNLAYFLTNTYLLFYYTNCAGIKAGPIGFMLVVTKVIDGLTDYLIGIFVDHTDTKMGRYRPWMLFGVPVLAVGMVALFSVPITWGVGSKLAWAYISYIIFSFGYTLVNIPMTPAVTSLSADPVERTKITTSRNLFASVGSLTSSLFVIPMVYFFAGRDDATGSALANGYRMTNIVLAIIVIIIMCISVFNIEGTNPPTVSKEKSNIFKDIKGIFKNKCYIIIILFVFFYFFGYLGLMAAIQYYFTYVIGSTSAMQIAMSLLTIIPMPIMIFCAYLNGKGFSKRKMLMFGGIFNIIGMVILMFTNTVALAVFGVAIYAFGNGFRNSMLFATLPDIFDYTEYQIGKSLAGTQTAFIGFSSKAASALATASVSALLVWGAYDPTAMDAMLSAGSSIGDVAVAFPHTILAIRLAFAGITIVTLILTILVLIPYDLDKKYPEVRAELDKRKAMN